MRQTYIKNYIRMIFDYDDVSVGKVKRQGFYEDIHELTTKNSFQSDTINS